MQGGGPAALTGTNSSGSRVVSKGFIASVALGLSLLTGSIAAADTTPADPAAVSLVHKFVDAFNRHDANAAASCVADNFRQIFPDGNAVVGKTALRDRIAFEFAAEPTVTIVIDHLVGDATTAAAELTYVPGPRVRPLAAQYVYVFAITGGQIATITVYSRSAEAQKVSAQPPATPTPAPHK
jgi:ketosteroid isomerase-like protein